MARTRFGYAEAKIGRMRYGKWADTFRAYRHLYNFEKKMLLYKDAEREATEYRKEHQKVASLLED